MLVDDKDYFLLDLLVFFPAPTLEPQQTELGDTQPESEPEHVSLVEENVDASDNRFPQVYLRRKSLHPRSRSIQALEPDPKTKVIPSNPPQSTFELDWPIAIRKGTRECTKQLRYPLSDFVSFARLSPCHK